jgi:hypothetical protein
LQKYGSNSKKIKQTLEYILNRDRWYTKAHF